MGPALARMSGNRWRKLADGDSVLTPPLPPRVRSEQALHFAESLARGEPNRSKIALAALSDKVRELV